MGSVPECLTIHARESFLETKSVLIQNGFNESLLVNLLNAVCENPKRYDRVDREGKRYICYKLDDHYIIVVFADEGKTRIITIFYTNEARHINKKCGQYHRVSSV